MKARRGWDCSLINLIMMWDLRKSKSTKPFSFFFLVQLFTAKKCDFRDYCIGSQEMKDIKTRAMIWEGDQRSEGKNIAD